MRIVFICVVLQKVENVLGGDCVLAGAIDSVEARLGVELLLVEQDLPRDLDLGVQLRDLRKESKDQPLEL